MLKKKFSIKDIEYVLYFDGVNFSMYNETFNNPLMYAAIHNNINGFGDTPPEKNYKKINIPNNVFKVFSEVKKFFDAVIKKETPFYFTFSANEPEKMKLYEKFAKQIAQKYGYYLVKNGNMFRFYKS